MTAEMTYRVAKLQHNATIPIRAKRGDAGMDLSSVDAVTVPARGRMLVDTGLAMEIPEICYARVAPRSGLAVKHGICVGAGVIDSSYRGPIKVLLFNHSDEDFKVNIGDRIAQIIFEYIDPVPNVVQVDYSELTTSDRGSGGFGSTGK